jgi:type VI secretion system protein ImpG
MFRAGSTPRDPAPIVQPASVVQSVGFGRDEGMLPYSNRSFLGYRLLTEYFTFPSKFMFFDLGGLRATHTRGYNDRLEVFLFLDRSARELENRVKTETFKLGCSPIVNLFTQEADPIHLTHAKHRYHVVPDARSPGQMEVYSIDAVRSTNVDTGVTTEYQPFYSFKHGSEADRQQTYWYARRRPSVHKDDRGTEMYLSLVNLDFEPAAPATDVITLQTTCTNRDLPGELRSAGGESWGFQLDGHAPLARIVPVVIPTASSRLPFDQGRWRLISHLALNHLSIADGEDGADALREILKLYDFAGSKVSAQHIAGVLAVNSRRAVAPITDGTGSGFCRGMEITVEFDEQQYAGSGVFLFASVLERFLGLYATLNSATRMVARSRQREGPIKRWPFRSGERTLT